MKGKLKIAYIVVGEDLTTPLLQRQVIELLGDIKQRIDDATITLFAFYGIPTIINHRPDIAKSKNFLNDLGIGLVIIPTICPWPIPNVKIKKTDVGWRPDLVWNRRAVRFFKVISLPAMSWIRLVGGYRLFHCRSYPSTSAAIFMKQFIRNTSVLFDPRSDFPEENVTAGSWGKESKDFKYWKSEEQRLLQLADAVACIGPTYVRHFRNNVESFNYFVVPNNVRCNDFKRDLSVRVKVRRLLGIEDHEAVFVYLGDMTEHGWHQPRFYKTFYQSLAQHTGTFRFLFLVPKHSANLVSDAFRNENNIIVASPPYGKIAEYLAAADYGMMFLHQSKIAVGTKIGEYLAASLPIIVNENCIGAVELLKTHTNLGYNISLGLGDLDNFNRFCETDILKIKNMLRTGALLSAFALNYFDNSVIADRYAQQYRALASIC